MNPVQYIIANKGANMSPGKLAAQVAHASVEGVRVSTKTPNGNPWDSSIVNRWYRGGQYAKIVLEAPDAESLRVAERYLNDRGIKTALIIDEGRTELNGLTVTALGSEIVNKDDPHVQAVFGEFKLYSDTPSEIIVVEGTLTPAHMERIREYVAEGRIDHARRYVAALNEASRPHGPAKTRVRDYLRKYGGVRHK